MKIYFLFNKTFLHTHIYIYFHSKRKIKGKGGGSFFISTLNNHENTPICVFYFIFVDQLKNK